MAQNKIGIIGGTGSMGKGFALRWCKMHDILIGSRDAKRAEDAAQQYANIAKDIYDNTNTISGSDNLTVAKESDILILSIPYENIDAICSQILPQIKSDCVVVSPIVPMTKTEAGFEFLPMKEGKPFAYQLVSRHMKDKSKLISAFHVISEKKLADPKMVLDYDIFVCGDDETAVETVKGLINEIEGLRPLYLGPGELSYFAEVSTPLLINAMIKNKLRNPGIKIM